MNSFVLKLFTAIVVTAVLFIAVIVGAGFIGLLKLGILALQVPIQGFVAIAMVVCLVVGFTAVFLNDAE